MREAEFSEMRSYAEDPDCCIDMGYRPGASLIQKGWLRETVRGCWQITPKGVHDFAAIVAGAAELLPDRDGVA